MRNLLLKIYHLFVLKKPGVVEKPYCRYVPVPAGPQPVFNPSLSYEENQHVLIEWLDRRVNLPLFDKGAE